MPLRPHKPRPPKNTKVTGERSEASFLTRAVRMFLGVAKPWGDSRRYDFIIDNGSRLLRIQVKCTESIRAQAYETRATYTVGKGRAVYSKEDIDFLAAHVVPLDIWYIIPVEICAPQPMLRFYPHREAKKMRLEKYREAWHLLQEEEKEENENEEQRNNEAQGNIDLQASADTDNEHDDEHDTDNEHVGTAAPGCPAAQVYRAAAAVSSTSPTHLPPTAAPWPIPPVQILATRKGRQILPTPKSD